MMDPNDFLMETTNLFPVNSHNDQHSGQLTLHQGYLLKKKKLMGFKKVYVVLNKGHLIYYHKESDAKNDRYRKGTFSLKSASLEENSNISSCNYLAYSWTIYFPDGQHHTLCSLTSSPRKMGIIWSANRHGRLPSKVNSACPMDRKLKWMDAFQKHIEFVTNDSHTLNQHTINKLINEFEEEFKTLQLKLAEVRLQSLFLKDKLSSMKPDKPQADITPALLRNRFENDLISNYNVEYFDAVEDLDTFFDKRSLTNTHSYDGHSIHSGYILDQIKQLPKGEDDKRDSGFATLFSRSSSLDEHLEQTDPWRVVLPAPNIDRSKISLWSIVKSFIGKDLTKITMPVILCEPLSFLQRISEQAQFSRLISRAAESVDPCHRMELVASYAVSLGANLERIFKPFNPIFGETFELVREDLGFRRVLEQVSHHPPISAYHTESLDRNQYWQMYGSVNPRIKFWGKSVTIEPKGTSTVEFPKFNETYFWRPAVCTAHNAVIGTPWFEYNGTVEIVCFQTGYKAVLTFHQYSRSNKELHKVTGYIYDQNMKKIKALYGYYTHCFYSCDPESFDNYMSQTTTLPTSKFDKCFNVIEPIITSSDSKTDNPIKNLCELWTTNPFPPDAAKDYYNFSYFATSLNEMRKGMEKHIAPTDSRFRSDIRRLEYGDIDGAGLEKIRLEEKQREARKLGNNKALWFELGKHSHTGEDEWKFNGKYWLRDFSQCPDLF